MDYVRRWGKWIAVGVVGLALIAGLALTTGRVRAAVVNWRGPVAAVANASGQTGAGSGCNMTGAAAASCPMGAGGQSTAPGAAAPSAPKTPGGSGFSCH